MYNRGLASRSCLLRNRHARFGRTPLSPLTLTPRSLVTPLLHVDQAQDHVLPKITGVATRARRLVQFQRRLISKHYSERARVERADGSRLGLETRPCKDSLLIEIVALYYPMQPSLKTKQNLCGCTRLQDFQRKC